MNWLEHLTWLPDFTSFVVSVALGLLALKETKSWSPLVRLTLVLLLLGVAVTSFVVSLRLKQQAAVVSARDRTKNDDDKRPLQAQITAMQIEGRRQSDIIAEDVRNKAAHPLILTEVEHTGDLLVGKPLGIRLRMVLTGIGDLTVLQKSGFEFVSMDQDVSATSNDLRTETEKAVWDRMVAYPARPMTFTFGEHGTAGNVLETTPVTAEQMLSLLNGHSLLYFMEELRNPETKEVVFSFCQFMDANGSLSYCIDHNKS